jgi:hypothetical protein
MIAKECPLFFPSITTLFPEIMNPSHSVFVFSFIWLPTVQYRSTVHIHTILIHISTVITTRFPYIKPFPCITSASCLLSLDRLRPPTRPPPSIHDKFRPLWPSPFSVRLPFFTYVLLFMLLFLGDQACILFSRLPYIFNFPTLFVRLTLR